MPPTADAPGLAALAADHTTAAAALAAADAEAFRQEGPRIDARIGTLLTLVLGALASSGFVGGIGASVSRQRHAYLAMGLLAVSALVIVAGVVLIVGLILPRGGTGSPGLPIPPGMAVRGRNRPPVPPIPYRRPGAGGRCCAGYRWVPRAGLGMVSMPGWGDLPPMPGEFERRNCDTRERIDTVLHRANHRPSPYRSHAELWRTVAQADRAREQFYDDLIACALRHGPGGLWFTVLLDAQAGAREATRQAQDQARDAARWEQDQAWASYAGNVAVAA
jgi:hypothetical protein